MLQSQVELFLDSIPAPKGELIVYWKLVMDKFQVSGTDAKEMTQVWFRKQAKLKADLKERIQQELLVRKADDFKTRRKQLNLTQAQVSKESGVSVSIISNFEKHTRKIKNSTYNKINDVLKPSTKAIQPSELSITIYKLRKKKKLSQVELAKLCPPITQAEISRLELGIQYPARHRILHIVRVLEAHGTK